MSARTTTMFLQDFTILDYAYLDSEKGLCGDSLYVSATLVGSLDHQGFVWDFGQAKKALKQSIDALVDHCCVVPEKSVALEWLGTEAFSLRLGNWEYSGPKQAILPLALESISPPALEEALSKLLRSVLPASIKELRLQLREEESFSREANFRYTHGLRYHDGNCQRLFHGHRNPVKVFLAGERSPQLEQYLAELCDNAHFAAKDNLAETDLPLDHRNRALTGTRKVEYRSSQGFFTAQVPAANIIVLAEEPSIENIAAFLLRALRKDFPDLPKDISVWAYEGLNKGAVATD